MKKIVFLSVVLIGLMTINSCKKKDPTPAPTNLEISVKDNNGNIVSGASVKLYPSQTDLSNGTNQIGTTQISDASGNVTFNNLSNIPYYFFIEKDCQNNENGALGSTALTANVNNTITAVLSSTGTLEFINTSSNPYQVYINGALTFTMNGGTTQYKYYMPTIGSYSIRVLQVSGYLVTPTDETFTGTIACGQTLTTTFP